MKKKREREKKYLESFHRFDLQILKYYLPKKQGEGIRRRIWKNFHLDRVQNPSSSVDQTKGNSSGRKSRAGAAHFHPVEDVLLKIFVVERFHGSIKWLSLSLFLLEENPRGDTRLTVHVEVEAHGHIHFSSAFLPPDNRPLPLSLSLSQGRAIVAPALGLKRVTHRYTSRRCWWWWWRCRPVMDGRAKSTAFPAKNFKNCWDRRERRPRFFFSRDANGHLDERSLFIFDIQSPPRTSPYSFVLFTQLIIPSYERIYFVEKT